MHNGQDGGSARDVNRVSYRPDVCYVRELCSRRKPVTVNL